MRYLITLVVVFFSSLSYATDYKIIPYNDFNQEVLGNFIRFKSPILYLVLDKSSPDFLKKNNNIKRMIATLKHADGNDIHEKEKIKDHMIFEVISIFKYSSPPPTDWPEEKLKQYLAWLEANPWVGVTYTLNDENGVLSTIGTGYLKNDTYDVTENRQLIKKFYSYEITPEIRKKLLEGIETQGVKDQIDREELIKKVSQILATKNMFIVEKLLSPCSFEIQKFCESISNGHKLIDCLKNIQSKTNSMCEEALKEIQ